MIPGVRTIQVYSVIFLALFLSAIVCIHTGSRSILKTDNAGKQTAFIGYRLGGAHAVWMVRERKLFSTRLLQLRFSADFTAMMITRQQKEYLMIINDKHASIYTTEGKCTGAGMIDAGYDTIISCCVSDLEADGTDELLLITGKKGSVYGDQLLVISFSTSADAGLHPCILMKHPMPELKPWKVQTADVDGDGRKEISVGVYKTAVFHPVTAKRPFIYSWLGGSIAPKWLGSRLARPFDDYIFSDINADGMDELISIELLSDGERVINSYRWKGFGFEGLAESMSFEDISRIEKEPAEGGKASGITARVRKNGIWRRADIGYAKEVLIVNCN